MGQHGTNINAIQPSTIEILSSESTKSEFKRYMTTSTGELKTTTTTRIDTTTSSSSSLQLQQSSIHAINEQEHNTDDIQHTTTSTIKTDNNNKHFSSKTVFLTTSTARNDVISPIHTLDLHRFEETSHTTSIKKTILVQDFKKYSSVALHSSSESTFSDLSSPPSISISSSSSTIPSSFAIDEKFINNNKDNTQSIWTSEITSSPLSLDGHQSSILHISQVQQAPSTSTTNFINEVKATLRQTQAFVSLSLKIEGAPTQTSSFSQNIVVPTTTSLPEDHVTVFSSSIFIGVSPLLVSPTISLSTKSKESHKINSQNSTIITPILEVVAKSIFQQTTSSISTNTNNSSQLPDQGGRSGNIENVTISHTISSPTTDTLTSFASTTSRTSSPDVVQLTSLRRETTTRMSSDIISTSQVIQLTTELNSYKLVTESLIMSQTTETTHHPSSAVTDSFHPPSIDNNNNLATTLTKSTITLPKSQTVLTTTLPDLMTTTTYILTNTKDLNFTKSVITVTSSQLTTMNHTKDVYVQQTTTSMKTTFTPSMTAAFSSLYSFSPSFSSNIIVTPSSTHYGGNINATTTTTISESIKSSLYTMTSSNSVEIQLSSSALLVNEVTNSTDVPTVTRNSTPSFSSSKKLKLQTSSLAILPSSSHSIQNHQSSAVVTIPTTPPTSTTTSSPEEPSTTTLPTFIAPFSMSDYHKSPTSIYLLLHLPYKDDVWEDIKIYVVVNLKSKFFLVFLQQFMFLCNFNDKISLDTLCLTRNKSLRCF